MSRMYLRDRSVIVTRQLRQKNFPPAILLKTDTLQRTRCVGLQLDVALLTCKPRLHKRHIIRNERSSQRFRAATAASMMCGNCDTIRATTARGT